MLDYKIDNIDLPQTIDIIRLIDNQNHTKGYFLPSYYETIIEKLSKELEYKKWVQEKKALIKNNEKLDDFMKIGVDSINNYLENEKW